MEFSVWKGEGIGHKLVGNEHLQFRGSGEGKDVTEIFGKAWVLIGIGR